MINDIIDYNRVVIDDVSTIRNAFILQDLVEELETLFSESMGKECVDFEVDMSGINRSAFGDGTRLVLHGDGSKIRRIAINMLSNVCIPRFLLLVFAPTLAHQNNTGIQIHSQGESNHESIYQSGPV